VRSLTLIPPERERRDILEWLSPLGGFHATQADFLSRWKTGTGEWLFTSPVFQTWLHGGGARTVWCTGMRKPTYLSFNTQKLYMYNTSG